MWRAPVLATCFKSRLFGIFGVAAHDDVIKWKHFPRYWPFVRGIHRSSPRLSGSNWPWLPRRLDMWPPGYRHPIGSRQFSPFIPEAKMRSHLEFTKYHNTDHTMIVARSRKSLATLTLGSSKINQHCWRFHGSDVIAAPQIIGLISFCIGMHHEYYFEVVNVLSCSPFMFENKQLDWRIRHSHLAPTLFHSLVPWWRPRRIRPQITHLSQLENSAMGTWPIYKNSFIPDWFEKWRDIKFWYRC